jgi:hypothetical protein
MYLKNDAMLAKPIDQACGACDVTAFGSSRLPDLCGIAVVIPFALRITTPLEAR